jgi:subtilisin family serine protease
MLRIHGVNLSVGYDFDPQMFACGQSPLCIEVDRLVRSGVVVVAAAGNTGYGSVNAAERQTNAGLSNTINDPGNASLAITVGSTHRDAPHTYGVSFFSSKGPTGDGRLKPDLVAPGEKIVSTIPAGETKRMDGTSMAAPHVSGAAALLLARYGELIGRPARIKEILCTTATDLGRERYFQGAGMVDALRALQSV